MICWLYLMSSLQILSGPHALLFFNCLMALAISDTVILKSSSEKFGKFSIF